MTSSNPKDSRPQDQLQGVKEKKKKKRSGFKANYKVLAVLRRPIPGYRYLNLNLARHKVDDNKVLRLISPGNWFKIADQRALSTILEMLKRGAEELNWDFPAGEIKPYKDRKDLEPTSCNSGQEEIISSQPSTNQTEQDFIREAIPRLEELSSSLSRKVREKFSEILQKLSQDESSQGIEELSELMESWNLAQITSTTNIIKNRLDVIELMSKLVRDDSVYELRGDGSIHHTLENNMWLISDSYLEFQSNRTLRSTMISHLGAKADFEGSSLRPDFVCFEKGSKVTIVEIKRPSLKVGKKEIDQLEEYLCLGMRFSSKKFEGILIGKQFTEEAKALARIRKSCQLKTYSDLVDDCRKKYKEYLENLKGK
ncbi:MAG: hypothetical protein ACFCA4_04215 [Cyanophyceae cyanobacterium]